MRILVFGDSIAWGMGDKKGGWVWYLKEYLDKIPPKNPNERNDYYQVYNLGTMGNSSSNLLNRFEFETKQRLSRYHNNIFIIAIGLNDARFYKNKNCNNISTEKSKTNIQDLIDHAKKYSNKIIFVGLTLVDESLTQPVEYNRNDYFNNSDIRKYNGEIENICVKNKVHYVDILNEFEKTDYTKLLHDGLHPNSKGHKLIYQTVKKYLIKNKII